MSDRTKKWTATEEERLRELGASGARLREAAAQLGRAESTVSLKAARLGISFMKRGEAHHRTTHSAAEIREIVRLHRSGWRNVQIARHLGIGKSYVSEVVNGVLRYRETLPHLLAKEPTT